MSAMPRASIDRRAALRTAFVAVAVALAAALPYLNSLGADFTFDDAGVIRDNAAVQVLPAVDLLHYVYRPGELYRPLTMLTYAANAAISPAPFGFHLVNVALHVLISLCVFFLARRLLRTFAGAACAALLFAAHPIHTEAVTNVVGRAELLAALGVLIALLACARAIGSSGHRRHAWLIVSLLAFAAGMLAKESAFTALPLFAVVHVWLDRKAAPRERAGLLWPYAVVAVAYLALRLAVVGALVLPEPPGALDNPLAHVDAAARIRTAIIVLWEYAALLAVPMHLVADYSYNAVPVALSWGDPRFLATAALLACSAVLVVSAGRRAPVVPLAAAFACIPLVLTANLLFPIGTIKAERLLYLPSVGWVLACGWLAAEALRRRSPRWALALALLVAVFGARTWLRNADWQDDATLFRVTLADAPCSAKAHYNGAVALQQAGQLDDAMAQYRRALEIYPPYAAAAFGIGHIYGLKGSDAGALGWYEEALRRDPKFTKAHLQIGLLRQRRGEYDAAEAALLTGLASDPNDPMLLVNLGAVRLSQGNRWEAQTALAQLDGIGTVDHRENEIVAAARREIEVALQ